MNKITTAIEILIKEANSPEAVIAYWNQVLKERDTYREVLENIAVAKGCEGYGEVLGGKLMDMARNGLKLNK
jgi:hypothetical protein